MNYHREDTTSQQSILHKPFHIAHIRQDNYRTRTYTFSESLPSQPGQFVMAWLPDVDEKPFCIASDDPFSLTIVAVGPFSNTTHSLQTGDRLWIRGPLGKGFHLSGKRILLAGGGYGVAPLYFLAKKALARNIDLHVCIGARQAQEILFVEQFKQLGVGVSVTTQDGSLGEMGSITTATRQMIEHIQPDSLYACGPIRMLEALEKQCAAYDLPRQLSWEAHMRCGMGLCGSCELQSELDADLPAGTDEGWLVCLDGPVSDSHPEKDIKSLLSKSG